MTLILPFAVNLEPLTRALRSFERSQSSFTRYLMRTAGLSSGSCHICSRHVYIPHPIHLGSYWESVPKDLNDNENHNHLKLYNEIYEHARAFGALCISFTTVFISPFYASVLHYINKTRTKIRG